MVAARLTASAFFLAITATITIITLQIERVRGSSPWQLAIDHEEPHAMAASIAQVFSERIGRLGLGLEFNQQRADAMLPASALRSAKSPAVLGKQQQHRRVQDLCVPGDSFSITSSLFSNMEDCYAIFEMTDNSTVYAASDGTSFVLDMPLDADNPSSEVVWVAVLFEGEDPEVSCVSVEDTTDAAHPSDASWICLVDGEYVFASSEEFSTPCGCDEADIFVFSTPSPSVESPSNAITTPAPTSTSEPSPTLDSTPAPTETTPAPTVITPEPTAITPKPTAITPKPTPTTPEPTLTTPEPTLTTSEPTLTTLEPTLTTPEPTPTTPGPNAITLDSTVELPTPEPTLDPTPLPVAETPTAPEIIPTSTTRAPMAADVAPRMLTTPEPTAVGLEGALDVTRDPMSTPVPHSTPTIASTECSASALSDAAQEQLAIYQKDIYLEPDCVNGAVPPLHCNYMGLGQECRGCFTTCDGAMDYMTDFPDEIADLGVDAIIHFCPGAEVEDFGEC